ncbi:MAG: hypothetical protein APF80_08045 [Alphaproteobacteria bacterium BRH_c36]|nr:MAG: hypothetical protein APF80_08045 [Alphaproteobacteria bacterium BRH_c36]
MRELGRDVCKQVAVIAAVFAAAIAAAGCGVSSPVIALPAIDHSRPATLLNQKQKDKALKEMDKLAEDQHRRAAGITPITYKIPEKHP